MVREMYLKGGGGSTSTTISLALDIARFSALLLSEGIHEEGGIEGMDG